MQSINSSKKFPINISIFDSVLTDSVFQDMRFVQLMNLLIQSENVHKYSYCFYCDSAMVKTNLFIPVFHTVYLSCQNNNVLIKDQKDIWLKDIFKNNKYYVLASPKDEFDYTSCGITKIEDIKQIDGVL